ncbi:MAG: NERD domain-containing protein [Psychromonas sp.]
MIVKHKETSSSKDVRQMAGDKQEQDVAFFLRRAYKDNPQVYVFNDLRFEHNEEIAQIDHLILYPYGFVLIESKSITGEVKVNNNQEWTRSYNRQWSGMRSPIKQVELQEKLLRELLLENIKQLLPKLLGMQQGFGGRCWDQICAISSNAIVHRDEMPEEISDQLVKSEFVVDKLTKLMNIPTSKIISFLKPTGTGGSRPWFSPESMDKISDFLIAQHKPLFSEQAKPIDSLPTVPETNQVTENKQNIYTADTNQNDAITTFPSISPETQPITQKLACKKCNNTEQLQGAWGKFGYYVKCPSCNTNTAMKTNCPICNSKNTKINKKKAHYYLTCQDCNAQNEVFVEG